ncbi:hypothetical protein RFI_04469 [Reticulomyxa filosa]|uniref:Uncharacterized protein n=1 Tax=Reticulomyxa filosa TaxID=46433 RepID=X6P3E5_RETFI|nr:hypothetical protein RFI_04469 [Reticulomyxa filosa]|eukprot:ETO32648.1 hypothetical protein RFI_04469 [Reticulomyxa filosa]
MYMQFLSHYIFVLSWRLTLVDGSTAKETAYERTGVNDEAMSLKDEKDKKMMATKGKDNDNNDNDAVDEKKIKNKEAKKKKNIKICIESSKFTSDMPYTSASTKTNAKTTAKAKASANTNTNANA